MTDRELLELAARAAAAIGMKSIDFVVDEWPDEGIVRKEPNLPATRRAIVRAAAEVGKGMLTHDEFVLMFPGRFDESEIDQAAAEIGKQRNSHE